MDSVRAAALGRDARASRLIIFLLSLGFVALLAAAAATFWVQRQNEDDARMVAHTLAVEANLGALASANERMETARRGLLLSGNPAFSQIFTNAARNARTELTRLELSIGDNSRQLARARRLEALLTEYDRHHREAIALSGNARDAMIADFMNDSAVANVREMRSVVDAMLRDELNLLSRREAGQKRTQLLFGVTLLATALLIVLVAGATLWLVRKNLVELRRSRVDLARLNENLEGIVDSRTSELKRANAEIQRFAYIVSHDLRAPLVNVMGFTAELESARVTLTDYVTKSEERGWAAPDDATRLAIAEDIPEAIGFIRSSTQKMDRLINAILNLSRQGRRNLAPERLELGFLVRGIVDSLQHRIDETGTRLDLEDLPVVVNDRVAVEQILSNLVENALKYLQPGRPGAIRISGGADLGRAWVAVADNGRGIDPRDHERVFDLFRRSGAQDQPGEGIGLAHARALAYRLGGFIEVQSELGEGSIFRLILPLEWQNGEEDA